MSNDYEDRFERHEQIMTGLARLHEAQHGINERLTAAIERLDITQARIETLLARMLRQEDNGRGRKVARLTNICWRSCSIPGSRQHSP